MRMNDYLLGLVFVWTLLIGSGATNTNTDDIYCGIGKACKAKLCLKDLGKGTQKECLTVSNNELGFQELIDSVEWNIEPVATPNQIQISTKIGETSLCLVRKQIEGVQTPLVETCDESADDKKRWLLNQGTSTNVSFVHNVWILQQPNEEDCLSPVDENRVMVDVTSNPNVENLEIGMHSCAAGTSSSESQLFVFKDASALATASGTIAKVDPGTDGRLCLQIDTNLCMGFSLPQDRLEHGLPLQIKDWAKNEAKNTTFKLEWHSEENSESFTLEPSSEHDLCIGVQKNEDIGGHGNAQDEMVLTNCSTDSTKHWRQRNKTTYYTVTFGDGESQCATVMRCSEKNDLGRCPRDATKPACQGDSQTECIDSNGDPDNLVAGADVRVMECDNLLSQRFVWVPEAFSVVTSAPSSMSTQQTTAPTPGSNPSTPSTGAPTAAVQPPPAANGSSGLLTAVLIILLLGAVLYAYFKIRKGGFTEIKDGENDFGERLGSGEDLADVPSQARNVEIVKIS